MEDFAELIGNGRESLFTKYTIENTNQFCFNNYTQDEEVSEYDILPYTNYGYKIINISSGDLIFINCVGAIRARVISFASDTNHLSYFNYSGYFVAPYGSTKFIVNNNFDQVPDPVTYVYNSPDTSNHYNNIFINNILNNKYLLLLTLIADNTSLITFKSINNGIQIKNSTTLYIRKSNYSMYTFASDYSIGQGFALLYRNTAVHTLESDYYNTSTRALFIPHNYALVLNIKYNKLELLDYQQLKIHVQPYLIPLFIVSKGQIIGGIGRDLFYNNAASNTSVNTDFINNVQLLFIPEYNNNTKSSDPIYFERDPNTGGIYLKLLTTFYFRGYYASGIIDNNYIINNSDGLISAQTSPNGVSDCIFIPHKHAFKFNTSTGVFSIANGLHNINNNMKTNNFVLANVYKSLIINGILQYLFELYSPIIANNNVDIISLNLANKDIANTLSKRRKNYSNRESCDVKFMFVSDIHKQTDKFNRTIQLANNWGGTYVDFILNTGDTVSGFHTEGLQWYYDILDTSNLPVLTAVGNHDTWITQNGSVVSTDKVDVYNLVTKSVVDRVEINQPNDASTNGLNYYYKDFNDSIRVIVLDCMYWDNNQNTWLSDVLSDAINLNLGVICCSHAVFPEAELEYTDSIWNYDRGYRDGTKTPIQAAQTVNTAINNGLEFISWFLGHTHSDEFLLLKNYNNQPVFITTSPREDNYSSTPKNLDSSKFDYDLINYVVIDRLNKVVKIMRIGANTDFYGRKHKFLTFNYNTKEIIYQA